MAATLTITGVAGAAVTVTASVFTGVTSFTVDTVNNVIQFTQTGVAAATIISVNAATTVTATKSSNTWTLTIS